MLNLHCEILGADAAKHVGARGSNGGCEEPDPPQPHGVPLAKL